MCADDYIFVKCMWQYPNISQDLFGAILQNVVMGIVGAGTGTHVLWKMNKCS